MSRNPVVAIRRRWQKFFLAMLPRITAHAKYSFRHLKPEARAEAVQEVVCNALQAFVRLVQLNKIDLAYPTVLASYGVKQARDGRKVGGNLNVRDVMSKYCQDRKNVTVERLDSFNDQDNCWEEAVVQDTRNSPVPETVAFRCDFSEWLKSLNNRDRRIARFLSLGNRTQDTAKRFKVSEGRVSQLRRELAESWQQFVGDDAVSDGQIAA